MKGNHFPIGPFMKYTENLILRLRRGFGRNMSRGQVRIRGIVLPVDWDTGGTAIQAAIFTPYEEEYVLEINEKAKRLFGLMQQEVEVRGMVKEEAGQKVITVRGYQRVKRRPDSFKVSPE